MGVNEWMKEENPEFYEASERLERMEQIVIDEMEKVKRLSLAGKKTFGKTRNLQRLVRNFKQQARRVCNIVLKQKRGDV